MYADMELWSEIRRRVLTNEMSKREACRVYEIHWATLKKILAHEEPPGYRRSRIPRRPTVEPVLPIKDEGEILLSYYSLGPRLLSKSAAVCIALHRLALPLSIE